MPSLTITYTAQEGQRVATAYGHLNDWRDENGEPRDATAAEVKQALINVLRGWVRQSEHQKAQQEIVIEPINPT
jgi:capsule polysaccharide export protein KpsE/RkpR